MFIPINSINAVLGKKQMILKCSEDSFQSKNIIILQQFKAFPPLIAASKHVTTI
ncbi:MAG: hypothetical protein ACI9ES_001365 [Oceanospirillaceae bacterium]|jgi:hypothetical protein